MLSMSLSLTQMDQSDIIVTSFKCSSAFVVGFHPIGAFSFEYRQTCIGCVRWIDRDFPQFPYFYQRSLLAGRWHVYNTTKADLWKLLRCLSARMIFLEFSAVCAANVSHYKELVPYDKELFQCVLCSRCFYRNCTQIASAQTIQST